MATSILLKALLAGATIWLVQVIAKVIHRLFFHPLAKFPGPRLAAATYFYEIYFDVCRAPGGQFMYELDRLHDIYGPVVRCNPDEIHVRKSSFIDTLYVSGGRVRDKWERANRANGSPGSVASTGPHDLHRMRRAAVNPFFSRRAIMQLEDEIQAKVQLLCDSMTAAAIRDGSDKGIINLGSYCTALTLEVIMGYCYAQSGDLLGNRDASGQWHKALSGIFEGVPVMKHFPILNQAINALPDAVVGKMVPELQVFIETKNRLGRLAQSAWEKTAPHILQSSAGEASEVKPATIFEGILESSLPAHEKSVSRLIDESFVLIVAGGETTARAITVTLVNIFQSPSLLGRLRKALDEGIVPHGPIPSFNELEKIPLLKATIQEGLRLVASVTNRPIQIAPNEDLKCGAWTIPRGTPISMSFPDVLHDPVIYPEPKKYDPDRWLVEDEQLRRLREHNLVAFGKGGRSCLGQNLAQVEMFLCVAAVVSRFDIDLIDFCAERDLDTVRDCFIGLPSKESRGVHAKVRARQ